MSDGWQVDPRPLAPELEHAVGRIRENLDLEQDRWSPAFAAGVQIIDRLDDDTKAKLGARLNELRNRIDSDTA